MEHEMKCELSSLDEEFPSLLVKIEENDDFIFETDSYALQNNKDYQELLKTLVKLQAQRIYTVKALEEVFQAREAVLKDSFTFVQALQNGEINFQPRIKIVDVPDIDMSKYDISSYIESIRPNTRRSTKESSISSHLIGSKKIATESTDSNGKPLKPKSATHNIYWSAEEQRRLEELLIKYPDEHIAAKRYAKIAKELGSRTLMQVQSRVQKYFLALKKEGLPVPGRDPKSAGLRHMQRKRSYASQTSSSAKFMKAFDFDDPLSRRRHVKVETTSEISTHSFDTVARFDEKPKIKIEEKKTSKLKTIEALKKIKKLKKQEEKSGDVTHLGIKCGGCLCEPIRGTRWQCEMCSLNSKLDLCSLCSKHFYTARHKRKHTLKPIYSMNVKDALKYLLNN